MRRRSGTIAEHRRGSDVRIAVVAEHPSEVTGHRYYEPSEHGAEAAVGQRLEKRWEGI